MSNNFEQQAKSRPKTKNLRPLLRLMPFLARYRSRILIALTALIIASAATLIVPIAVRRVLDNGFTNENATLVNQYFAVMFAVVATLAASSAIRFYNVMWIGERVVADVRDALFRHLMILTPSFYENQKTGEVVSRLTADTTQIKSAFSSTASIALRNLVSILGALIMMVYTSPRMSGLAALAIPGVVLPLVFYGRRVRALSRKAQDTLASSAAFAQERLSGITAIQSNTQELATTSTFANATVEAFEAAQSRTFARSILTFAMISVSMGAIVGLLWFGAHEVLAGRMTGGTLGQFVLYAVFAASALGQLSEVWGEVQLAAGAAERISELLDEKPAIVSPSSPIELKAPVQGTVTFHNVDFRYAARPETKVLNKISFSAKPSEVIAIVGPSGAGKTTLFALLQRFQDPEKGTVTLDNINIAKLKLEDLRGSIATVPQDPTIFSGTIAENIRLSRPEASDAEVIAAANAARVAEFANKLPLKYETLLGDAQSESLIQEALEGLTKGRTTLVIAHRLATVRGADRIIVLDQGKIVGIGTHAQLLKKSALYAKLAKLQFTSQ
jgi:ATP-binding cassette, subfamily B, bacterial